MKMYGLLNQKKGKRASLKQAYYVLFFLFVVLPILGVLILSFLYLNNEFKKQSLQNIEQAQETIITELLSDVEVTSMRLSSIVYANNSETMGYAAGANDENVDIRYEYMQKLVKAENLALEPVKDIISIYFYMKEGNHVYLKSESKKQHSEIVSMEWYQKALKNPNQVYVGVHDTVAINDQFIGGKKDMMILEFALSPNLMTDRSEKIEMVVLYQSSGVAERIKRYNLEYKRGENKLGITQIVNKDGEVLFTTEDNAIEGKEEDYTTIRNQITFQEETWYVENIIATNKLTADFWRAALIVLGIAIVVLLLISYFSRYFIRNIVRPIEATNKGLKQVEEGNLEIHIEPAGQHEIRSMIHQFNAMVRRLRIMLKEHENETLSKMKDPAEWLKALVRKEISPDEVEKRAGAFFKDPYLLIGVTIASDTGENLSKESIKKMVQGLDKYPRYATRSISYVEKADYFVIFYRVIEEDYREKLEAILSLMIKDVKKEYDIRLFACAGEKCHDYTEFEECLKRVEKHSFLRHLGKPIFYLEDELEFKKCEIIHTLLPIYAELATALYNADEKNVTKEKEKLFKTISQSDKEGRVLHILAAITSIGIHFTEGNVNFGDILGQTINYVEKVGRLDEIKETKMWLTNYFAWIVDYMASKLNTCEADIIVKAKRYIATNYDDSTFSLSKVAKHVGLNEKYLTNRFTKEAGETFTEYLCEVRMMEAKKLLRTTNFKVYEIAEMVGYNNVEHFNRMFKKIQGITPSQYRKAKNNDDISN